MDSVVLLSQRVKLGKLRVQKTRIAVSHKLKKLNASATTVLRALRTRASTSTSALDPVPVPIRLSALIPKAPTPAPAGKATQEMEQCAPESARVLTWRGVQTMASASLREKWPYALAMMGLLEKHVKTLMSVESARILALPKPGVLTLWGLSTVPVSKVTQETE